MTGVQTCALPISVAGDTLTITSPGNATITHVLLAAEIGVPYAVTYPTPAEGQTLTVNAQLTDIAGNVGATGTDNAKVVTTNPSVVIVEDTNNDGFSNSAELAGSLTVTARVNLPAAAAAGDTITVSNGTSTFNIILLAADISSEIGRAHV